MFRLSTLTLVMIVNVFGNDAAAIRTFANGKNAVLVDFITTTMEPDQTLIKGSDITIAPTGSFEALSKDEQVNTLIVDQTLLDLVPAEVIKSETQNNYVNKFGRLLLLSTSKIAEKEKPLENNYEESEEDTDVYENITQDAIETSTMTTIEEEANTKINIDADAAERNTMYTKDATDSSTEEQITKLYLINDTFCADDKKKLFESKMKESVVEISKVQTKEPLNRNLCSDPQESESVYILVDSNIAEGSYTDVDSELHLQPIVESIEIVPYSLNDTFFISYLHGWQL